VWGGGEAGAGPGTVGADVLEGGKRTPAPPLGRRRRPIPHPPRALTDTMLSPAAAPSPQVVFNKLGLREVRAIAGIMLQETITRVAEKG
jgi:hypothetical protein